MKSSLTFFLLFISVNLFAISPADAIWPENGILVYSASEFEDSPVCMISDGAGAVILAMYSEEYHGFGAYGVVQKIDSTGVLQWDPPAWLSGGGDWSWPTDMVSDGAGGAFVTYCDYLLKTRAYAARIYSDGSKMGLPVCSEEEGAETFASIAADNAENVIIAFSEYPPGGSDYDIYAQRDSSDGSALWGSCGIEICGATGHQTRPLLVSDNEGGAIIAWKDGRGGLYAQRVDPAGNTLWATDGIGVCTSPGTQDKHEMIADGEGGAFIAWQDERSGDFDIYVQRIDPSGTSLWDTNGVAVCTETFNQDYPFLVSDGVGGAFIVWRDLREGDYDVYAQRFDENGNMLWEGNGIAIAEGVGNQRCQRMVEDGVGGAIIAWVDETGSDFDVYSRRINVFGGFTWLGDRLPVCTATGNQDIIAMACVDTGAAIIAWKDERSGVPYVSDVYAMLIRYETITSISDNESVLPYGSGIAIVNYPNPFNPGTRITYRIPERCHVRLDVYNILGRRIKCLVDQEKEDGFHTIEWDGRDQEGNPVGSGIYFSRLKAGNENKTVKMVLIR